MASFLGSAAGFLPGFWPHPALDPWAEQRTLHLHSALGSTLSPCFQVHCWNIAGVMFQGLNKPCSQEGELHFPTFHQQKDSDSPNGSNGTPSDSWCRGSPAWGQRGPRSCWSRQLGGCCREAKALGKLQICCKQQTELIFLFLLTVLSTRLFPKAESKISHSPYWYHGCIRSLSLDAHNPSSNLYS